MFLDAFTGPLDLLLYLIRREKIDILDIPIVHITEQYMQYIEQMKVHRMELAADYLVMAAILAEIKSRLLLPVVSTQEEGEEVDPRVELVQRLQIYEQFKQAAVQLNQLPRRDRDLFSVCVRTQHLSFETILPSVHIIDLIEAQKRLNTRQKQTVHHEVVHEKLLVRDRIVQVLQRLQIESCVEFTTLFQQEEGRRGVIVALLAILELAKQMMLAIIQADLFTPIYVQRNDDQRAP